MNVRYIISDILNLIKKKEKATAVPLNKKKEKEHKAKKYPSLSTIASEIAETLSLTHHKSLAYKYLLHDGFRIMIGLCVEPNRFTSAEFYVYYFYQPLYRPVSFVTLNLGDRIGEWERKDLSVALPIIKNYYAELPCDSIDNILDKVNQHELHYLGSIGSRYEYLAYSYLVIKKYDKARDYLNQIVALESGENPDWMIPIIERAKTLLELIDAGKWTEIRELLLGWQKYTMTELKLPDQ